MKFLPVKSREPQCECGNSWHITVVIKRRLSTDAMAINTLDDSNEMPDDSVQFDECYMTDVSKEVESVDDISAKERNDSFKYKVFVHRV